MGPRMLPCSTTRVNVVNLSILFVVSHFKCSVREIGHKESAHRVREGLFEFVEQSRMPDLTKCLTDVN
jgi:hypothetical protein